MIQSFFYILISTCSTVPVFLCLFTSFFFTVECLIKSFSQQIIIIIFAFTWCNMLYECEWLRMKGQFFVETIAQIHKIIKDEIFLDDHLVLFSFIFVRFYFNRFSRRGENLLLCIEFCHFTWIVHFHQFTFILDWSKFAKVFNFMQYFAVILIAYLLLLIQMTKWKKRVKLLKSIRLQFTTCSIIIIIFTLPFQ